MSNGGGGGGQTVLDLESQGWIIDMGIDGPTFASKGGYFFTNSGQGLSQKVGFFLLFGPILRSGFFGKMLRLSNKKSTFVLVSDFFYCCISNIIPKVAF